MTKVKIAQLKTHLSGYLKQVRQGKEIIVTERDNPIARILPFKKEKEKLVIIPAKEPWKTFKDIIIPPALPGIDSLKILLEDRDE